MRDAVCYVCELIRGVFVKISEYCLFQYFRVETGNPVDLVAAHYAQVSHFYHVVGKYGHLSRSVPIASVGIKNITAEPFVYFLDYGVYSGQLGFYCVFVQRFQSLLQHGVICIGNRALHQAPGMLPGQSMLIHKYAHQFRYH
ncbi:hypothetical protein SDC9_171140 [bioreactor metagenome]|uniref:Uncharacterized protein n=1 Tax=bioreactor metagenome TaxID=1076179 RepID=A0A645GA13_9ZZZZ